MTYRRTLVIVGLSIGAIYVFLPIFDFIKLPLLTRSFVAASFLISLAGVLMRRRWGSRIGQGVMWMSLFWIFLTLTPDAEQAVLEGTHIDSTYLIIRIIIVTGYSLLMLWHLSRLDKLGP